MRTRGAPRRPIPSALAALALAAVAPVAAEAQEPLLVAAVTTHLGTWDRSEADEGGETGPTLVCLEASEFAEGTWGRPPSLDERDRRALAAKLANYGLEVVADCAPDRLRADGTGRLRGPAERPGLRLRVSAVLDLPDGSAAVRVAWSERVGEFRAVTCRWIRSDMRVWAPESCTDRIGTEDPVEAP